MGESHWLRASAEEAQRLKKRLVEAEEHSAVHCVGSVEGMAYEVYVLQTSYKVVHQDLDEKCMTGGNFAHQDQSGIRLSEGRHLLQVGFERVAVTVRSLHDSDMIDSAHFGQTLEFGDLRTRWTAILECLGFAPVNMMKLEHSSEMQE